MSNDDLESIKRYTAVFSGDRCSIEVESVRWLIAEVERLRGEIQATQDFANECIQGPLQKVAELRAELNQAGDEIERLLDGPLAVRRRDLRTALQSLYDATAWFSGSEGLIANARERAGVVLGGGNDG